MTRNRTSWNLRRRQCPRPTRLGLLSNSEGGVDQSGDCPAQVVPLIGPKGKQHQKQSASEGGFVGDLTRGDRGEFGCEVSAKVCFFQDVEQIENPPAILHFGSSGLRDLPAPGVCRVWGRCSKERPRAS